MKLKDIVNQIDITIVNDTSLDREVKAIYIGDLLSMVMAKANEDSLWLTVQTHVNAVAVAQMLDFSGIIFIEGLEPDANTLQKANELAIPLFTSRDDAYTLATKLSQLGI